METVRVFLVVVCLVAFNRLGVSGGGVVGYERGNERLFPEQTGKGARAVVEAAGKEVGVREDSENAGKRVDEYNAYVGVKKVAWCAAFVSWCFGQAGYAQPRTAWSPALFPKRRLRAKAQSGMIMGVYFPSMGRIAHCGIVESVRGDYIISIEGNTNSDGSRNGNGVYRRMRHKRSVAKFSNWVKVSYH